MIFENLAKIANLGKDKNENFKCQMFDGKHFILTPFKRAANRFQYIVTEVTQYTIYGKVNWVVLKLS